MEKADDEQQSNQGLVVLVLVAELCLTLCDPVDYSPPGPSVRGILQARTLERVAIPSPGDPPDPSLLHCRRILHHLNLRGSPNKCLCTCKFFKAGAQGEKHNVRESGRKEEEKEERKEGENEERKEGREGRRQEKARKGGEVKKQKRVDFPTSSRS